MHDGHEQILHLIRCYAIVSLRFISILHMPLGDFLQIVLSLRRRAAVLLVLSRCSVSAACFRLLYSWCVSRVSPTGRRGPCRRAIFASLVASTVSHGYSCLLRLWFLRFPPRGGACIVSAPTPTPCHRTRSCPCRLRLRRGACAVAVGACHHCAFGPGFGSGSGVHLTQGGGWGYIPAPSLFLGDRYQAPLFFSAPPHQQFFRSTPHCGVVGLRHGSANVSVLQE